MALVATGSLRRIVLQVTTAAMVFSLAAACHRSSGDPAPVVQLVTAPGGSGVPVVEVSGISAAEQRALASAALTQVDWQRVLAVRVKTPAGDPQGPVAGTYRTAPRALHFTPAFPFDPGREYEVTFNRGAIPGSAAAAPPPSVTTTVALPAAPPSPSTVVTGVYPSSDEIPENLLRLYVHFSAPMGRRGGLEHVRLLDDSGREVTDPFLPVEAEFWNADSTRYTVFFDPGRQKRGILPNREMGASLIAGRRYTLVVSRDWIDGNGNPLREPFTRRFHVGPPHLSPLDPARWLVEAPPPGSRAPLSVTFAEPLDHGLLMRAIGVRREGLPVTGEVTIEAQEKRWAMRPADPWRQGRYELIALPILEDRAGNRIGRAFEIVGAAPGAQAPEPVITTIPFNVAAVR